VQGLLQSFEHRGAVCRARGPPSDDAPDIGVDNEVVWLRNVVGTRPALRSKPAGGSKASRHFHGQRGRLRSRRREAPARLDGLSPETVLRQRLEAAPALAYPTCRPPNPSVLERDLRSVADARAVSQPGSERQSSNGTSL
jgi:hypothetical protein